MSSEQIQQILDRMEPQKAVEAISLAIKRLFSSLDEQARVDLVVKLFGDAGQDKIGSLVNL